MKREVLRASALLRPRSPTAGKFLCLLPGIVLLGLARPGAAGEPPEMWITFGSNYNNPDRHEASRTSGGFQIYVSLVGSNKARAVTSDLVAKRSEGDTADELAWKEKGENEEEVA